MAIFLSGLPDTKTIKGSIHRVQADACHLGSISLSFRSATSRWAATQPGSSHQTLLHFGESSSALWGVCDGLGYVRKSSGSCRFSVWHLLEWHCKLEGCPGQMIPACDSCLKKLFCLCTADCHMCGMKKCQPAGGDCYTSLIDACRAVYEVGEMGDAPSDPSDALWDSSWRGAPAEVW